MASGSFFDLSAKTITKEDFSFKELSGKVVLVVNVASRWGLTKSNYAEFVTLQDKYTDKGLTIMAFPCNQFGAQEPGTNEQIAKFAADRGFKGLLMDKVDVNGPGQSPVYSFLKEGSGDTSDISWNFGKFLVAKDGSVYGRYEPRTSPCELQPQIEELLS